MISIPRPVRALSLLFLGLSFAFGAWSFSQHSRAQSGACHPAYPDNCVPPPPPDLDCADLVVRNFRALPPDPHGFDTDGDGVGCEDATVGSPTPSGKSVFRAYGPMVACDSCAVSASPTPTATATATTTTTATATTTPTATSTTTATATPTNTPTATPTTSGACVANATITALDKVGESVTISGSGTMTGWYIISESGNQRFDFPAGYVLNGSVVIDSGPGAVNNPPGTLLWTTANIWNNSSDDDAFLYDCLNALRSSFEDGD